MTATPSAWIAGELGWGIAEAHPTAGQQRQARDIILTHMANDSTARYLASYAANLTSLPEDKQQVREALMGMLFTENEAEWAAYLAEGIAMLDPTLTERRAAIGALLSFPVSLAPQLVELACTGLEAQEALSLLLELSDSDIGSLISRNVLDEIRELARTAPDRQRSLRTLLDVDWAGFNLYNALDVAGSVAALGPAADDRRQLTRKLIGLLTPDTAHSLLPEIIRLAETEEERAHARRKLLGFLPQVNFITAVLLIQRVLQLSPTADELQQAFDAAQEATGLRFFLERKNGPASEQPSFRDSQAQPLAADDFSDQFRRAALEELAKCADGAEAAGIARQASRYRLTAEEKRQCRSILLNHLGMTQPREAAERLIRELTQLDPASEDLATWSTWAAPPTIGLLAAARYNSEFPDWFRLLPVPVTV
jgi:hypothetical protein